MIKRSLLAVGLLIAFFSSPATAQPSKTLAISTVQGVVNGLMLGGGTMALANTENVSALRVGTGAGTLFGFSLGVYDVINFNKTGVNYVEGSFSSGGTTQIIILLDTFYGGVTGALLGGAVSLIVNERFVKGLQYGSGVGVWAGFGFGLIDAFALSNRNTRATAVNVIPPNRSIPTTNGLLSLVNSESASLSTLAPGIFNQGVGEIDLRWKVDFVQLSVAF